MHSLTCMSVVVCVVRKLRPCNSYSRRRDRINSVLWRSYYKGGGGGRLDRFPPMAKVTAVTTVFPYTGLLRLLLGPKSQTTSGNKYVSHGKCQIAVSFLSKYAVFAL